VLVAVSERREEETKKCALAIVMGLGLLDHSVVMTNVSPEGAAEKR